MFRYLFNRWLKSDQTQTDPQAQSQSIQSQSIQSQAQFQFSQHQQTQEIKKQEKEETMNETKNIELKNEEKEDQQEIKKQEKEETVNETKNIELKNEEKEDQQETNKNEFFEEVKSLERDFEGLQLTDSQSTDLVIRQIYGFGSRGNAKTYKGLISDWFKDLTFNLTFFPFDPADKLDSLKLPHFQDSLVIIFVDGTTTSRIQICDPHETEDYKELIEYCQRQTLVLIVVVGILPPNEDVVYDSGQFMSFQQPKLVPFMHNLTFWNVTSSKLNSKQMKVLNSVKKWKFVRAECTNQTADVIVVKSFSELRKLLANSTEKEESKCYVIENETYPDIFYFLPHDFDFHLPEGSLKLKTK